MKNAIFEFINPSDSEKSELWDNCTFVFDTNVLLNLYRYSSKTRKVLISAIKNYSDRIWMPYQVAFEFMKNRCGTIFETADRYEILLKSCKDLKNNIQSTLRLSEDDPDLQKVDAFLKEWVNAEKESDLIVTSLTHDVILDELLSLFDGKTGKPYSEEETKKIFAEGKERFEKQIPPGFADSPKQKSEINANNMYGDLVVWKQILGFAKEDRRNIIFVTHDQKGDWWYTEKGRTVGPRYELVKEFITITKQKFYMYTMKNFISTFQERSGKKVEKSVIDEMKNMEVPPKKLNLNIKKIAKTDSQKLIDLENEINTIKFKLERQREYMSQVYQQYPDGIMPDSTIKIINNTELNVKQLEETLKILQYKKEFLIALNFASNSK